MMLVNMQKSLVLLWAIYALLSVESHSAVLPSKAIESHHQHAHTEPTPNRTSTTIQNAVDSAIHTKTQGPLTQEDTEVINSTHSHMSDPRLVSTVPPATIIGPKKSAGQPDSSSVEPSISPFPPSRSPSEPVARSNTPTGTSLPSNQPSPTDSGTHMKRPSPATASGHTTEPSSSQTVHSATEPIAPKLSTSTSQNSVTDHSTTPRPVGTPGASSASEQSPTKPAGSPPTPLSSTPGKNSPTESALTTEVKTPTTINSTNNQGVLITQVPKGKDQTSEPGVQSCTPAIWGGVVSQCLIAIATLSGVATIFMVSTVILCAKLSARKYRCVQQVNPGTELVCISTLLPERNNQYGRQRNPRSNGALIPITGDDSDEDGGDTLTLHSFLPDNDHV